MFDSWREFGLFIATKAIEGGSFGLGFVAVLGIFAVILKFGK